MSVLPIVAKWILRIGRRLLDDGCHITIGDGCTIGTGAFVNYGVTIMGDGAVLRTDSFAMKGEHIPPHTRWRGHPAADASDHDGRRPPAAQLATHEPSS
jgi:acetyltransferase-like isoleucine patch superfamily enzyme